TPKDLAYFGKSARSFGVPQDDNIAKALRAFFMARKLNTRFVLIASLVVAGVMFLGAGAVWYHRHHRDPKKLLATAQACEQEGKFVDASKHYAAAAQLMHDPKLMTQAGDLMYKISYDDEENLSAARMYWDSAVAMD